MASAGTLFLRRPGWPLSTPFEQVYFLAKPCFIWSPLFESCCIDFCPDLNIFVTFVFMWHSTPLSTLAASVTNGLFVVSLVISQGLAQNMPFSNTCACPGLCPSASLLLFTISLHRHPPLVNFRLPYLSLFYGGAHQKSQMLCGQ